MLTIFIFKQKIFRCKLTLMIKTKFFLVTRPFRSGNAALHVLYVAVAYYITGKLGTLLAVPPGYATAIWPPSGIALASVLIYGNRIWPGILLGSFLINYPIALAGNPFGVIFSSVAIAFLISSGATLQALSGAYLLRRFAGFPNDLSTGKEVGLFMLIGGLGSALVNSTIAVSSLVVAERIPVENFLTNWGTWWVGDAIGICIFTPLTLVWLLRPDDAWKRRRLVITFTILAMFSLTTLLVAYESQKENEHLKLEFENQSTQLGAALERSLFTHINELKALESFYSASNDISRDAFRIFVTHSLTNFNGIQALEWAPIVSSSARKSFEMGVAKEGYQNFNILEHNEKNELIKAGSRPEYVPVTFIEPYHGNKAALGYDLYSNEIRKTAIIQARDTGEVSVTQRIVLVQEQAKQFGVLAFIPVYQNGLPHQTVEDRRRNIKGYILAVFRCGDIVNAAFKDFNLKSLSLRLVDSTAPAEEQLLFSSNDKKVNLLDFNERGLFGLRIQIKSALSIPIGGHQWRFEVVPKQEYLSNLRSDNAWLILLLGFFLTSVVGSFAVVLSGRENILRRLVDERNKSMQRESEKNIVLLHNASDGIHILDYDGNVIEASDSFCDMLGYSREEVIGMNVSQWDAGFKSTDEIQSALKQQFDNPNRSQFETRHRRKDGSIFDVEVSGYPLTLEGTPVLFNSSRDITKRKKAEEAMRESESRFQIMADNAPVLIWIAGTDGLCFWFNKVWLDFTGRTMEQEKGNGWAEGVHPDDFKSCLDAYLKAFDARQEFNLEYRLRRFDGEYRWLSDNGVPRYDDHGMFLGYIGSCVDITNRKNSEAEMRIAATAFESQEGMLITDCHGEILRVNRAFTSITGYTSEEVIGKNPRLLSSGRHNPEFYASMWKRIKEGGEWEGEIWNKRKSGEVYPEHLTITAVKDSNGNVSNYVATLSDITMSKAAAEKIENLAFYDSLTSLPNRRLLLDRLHVALATSARNGRQGALLFLDLDHFKTLNDTLGHDVGDDLLKQVAARLTACVREEDTVARLGGDEFVVMLEELSEHSLEAATQIESVGDKILASLNQPYQLGSHVHHSTTSIGVAMFSDHEHEIDELLKQADIAMYQAKKAGRNTLRFFDPKMQESIHARALLESELHEAIDKNQFELYYQIQMDSEDHVIGAEALIRWNHPIRGIVSPVEFIPLAEETGMIQPIGDWVLETACHQLKLWATDSKTKHLQLAINVSAKQFRKPEFVEQVSRALQRHNIDSKNLKLELTESVMLENVEENIHKMNALKQAGVFFSIDDFGTGYSSLSYITQLPLDRLKIDQSFVRNLGENPRDDAIVQTIIGMARNLGLQVIAEGVETDHQLALLRQYGCTQYQGYLFSQPVRLDVFEKLLRT